MSGVQDFPYLTLSQVVEAQDLLADLTEVPVINGMTVDGVEALVPRLLAMVERARDLEDIADRAGFELTPDRRAAYGSVARIYIQGPGAAQVRLDVGKKIEIVELDGEEMVEGGTGDLDFFEPDPAWELGEEANVVDLFNARRGLKPEVND